MPHPDYRVVDVSLRLDQVADLMHLVDDAVATSRWTPERAAGPMAGLLGAIPDDSPHLRPGPMHWLWLHLAANR